MTERTYFASSVDASVSRDQAILRGYIQPGQDFYELQKNDDLPSFASDAEAIKAALADAAAGDEYAIEQLRLAQFDPLVRALSNPTL